MLTCKLKFFMQKEFYLAMNSHQASCKKLIANKTRGKFYVSSTYYYIMIHVLCAYSKECKKQARFIKLRNYELLKVECTIT